MSSSIACAGLLCLALSAAACKDDPGQQPKPDSARADQRVADGAGARERAAVDARAVDGSRPAEARADARRTDAKSPVDAPSAIEAGGTPCGSQSCGALQVCVGKTPVGPSTQWSCQPVIKGCEGASFRTCACLGKALCQAPFDTCTDSKLPNTILCECPACQ